MKCPTWITGRQSKRVVPHEGTWIEIYRNGRNTKHLASFPTRERGLKFLYDPFCHKLILVVPHEGTWIEIRKHCSCLSDKDVVPHEGTWIEIPVCVEEYTNRGTVVPHEGTWIEMFYRDGNGEVAQSSFPTRERGLKYHCIKISFFITRRSPRGNVD